MVVDDITGKISFSEDNKAKKGAMMSPINVDHKSLDDTDSENIAVSDDFWTDVSQFETDTEVEDIDVDNEMFTLTLPGKTKNLVDPEMMKSPLKYVSPNVKKLFKKFGPFMYRKSDWNELKLDKTRLATSKLVKYRNSSRYYGQLRKGSEVKEGRGVMVFTDGSLYEGFWKNNKQSGKGRMIYKVDAIYQGNWKSGNHHGLGIYIGK
jgi:hypothetical protein